MVELILVEHGLPERTRLPHDAASHPPDPPLNDPGRQQAEVLACYVGDEVFAGIYPSPLRRAVETAQPLATRWAITIRIVHALTEIDFDGDSYIPVEQLTHDDPRLQLYRAAQTDPKNEVVRAFRLRLMAGLLAINIALAGLLESPVPFAFRIDYASVTRIRLGSRGRVTVHGVNDRSATTAVIARLSIPTKSGNGANRKA